MTSKYRHDLPLAREGFFVTDAGLETWLIFHQGIELPHFAAFHLLKTAEGTTLLRRYFAAYARIAESHQAGLVLESPTWRANPDWAARLGYDAAALAAANRAAIRLMAEVRDAADAPGRPAVISGNLGPRGDGYRADARMTAADARAYHAVQIATFAGTAADLVSAFTLTYRDEAIGVALAARDHGMPVVLSFTLETDGRLPSGERLADAIDATDTATGGYPLHYMINCAHPTHFDDVLGAGGAWRERIRGVRANASRRSHAELDQATELDDGDPGELGAQYRGLRARLPRLSVVGGCCGTDARHVAAIAQLLAAR